MRKYVILFFLFLSFLSHGQKKDTNCIYFPYKIYYTGSETKIDLNYLYILDYLSEEMKNHPDWTLKIRGHVCCGPSQRISEKRAKYVYRYLIQSGIQPSRMCYKGYSNTIPISLEEKTEEDKQRNRRVDFMICFPENQSYLLFNETNKYKKIAQK